jgi:DNA repair exonuclease SbcCD ATPase subunit
VTSIHADIDALKGLHEALVRYRHAQREVAGRGEEETKVIRASLEAKVGRWRAQLEQCQAELSACRERAAQADADGSVATDDRVDCSGYVRAAEQCEERLEQIRRWQQRIDAEASEFQGTASRFGDLLENDLPRTEEHLLAIIRSLEAARRVQAPGA